MEPGFIKIAKLSMFLALLKKHLQLFNFIAAKKQLLAARAENEDLKRENEILKINGQVKDAQIEALQEKCDIDDLTGLLKRKAYDHDAYLTAGILARSHSRDSFGALFIDLDNFKGINDKLGHATGDTVLRAVAKRLQLNVSRQSDTVARYGGEELVVAMTLDEMNEMGQIPEQAIMSRAEEIRKDIEKNCKIWLRDGEYSVGSGDEKTEPGFVRKVTASIGASLFVPADVIPPTDLAKEVVAVHTRADAAMYWAKHMLGRNKTFFVKTDSQAFQLNALREQEKNGAITEATFEIPQAPCMPVQPAALSQLAV